MRTTIAGCLISLLMVVQSARADVYDDFGWAGDVGLVTGLTFELTNGPDKRYHPDPLFAEIAMLSFDYAGQRALRNEPLFGSVSSVEGEEMITAFAINQGILIPIECLLHLR